MAIAGTLIGSVVFAAATALGGQSSTTGSAPNGTCGFCVLAPSGQALALSSNSSVGLTKGNVVVDSSGSPAVSVTENATLKAPSVGVVGTASVGSNALVQNLTTGIAPVADPLAGLQAPSLPVPNPVPSMSLGSNASQTISPGVYDEISVTSNSVLTMSPGIYVVRKRFQTTENGEVTAKNVTIYLACSAYPTPCASGEQGAPLNLASNGLLNLTGPAERCSPVAVFADRNNTAPISVADNGNQTLAGVIYAKSGSMSVPANGATLGINGAVVVGSATFSGNGGISITGSLPLTEGLALSLSSAPSALHVGETETVSASLTCNGKPLASAPVNISVAGANPTQTAVVTDANGNASFSYKGTVLGGDTVQATYTSGGANIASAPSSVTWSKAQPTITTKATATEVTLGETIGDTATVSGGYLPNGTVTFNVYAASDTACATPLNLQPLTALLSGEQASSPAYTPNVAGTYQFVASYGGNEDNEPTQDKCGEAAEQEKVTGWIGPIEAQPQNLTANEGQAASFTVAASTRPAATVQWQLSTDGGNTWTNDTSDPASTSSESQKTTSTLTINNVNRSQNGNRYRAVLTNPAGSITSEAATLTVDWAGPVTTQPEARTVTEGQPVSLSAAASSNPSASVQWQVSADGGSSWSSDTSDAASTSSQAATTTSTLMIASANRNQNGYQYRAVFTNTAGSATSNAATLTVQWIGAIEAQPQSQTANEGQTAVFTTTAASNPGAAVQWQLSTDAGTTWTNDTMDTASTATESDKTTSTLTVSAVSRDHTGYQYRVVFTNAAGSLTTNAATLTVHWVGPVTAQPESETAKEGKPVSFTASASASPEASVQWQVSTDEGASWSNDTGDTASTTSVSDTTTSVLTIASTNHSENGHEYRAIFTNNAGSVVSQLAILTVERASFCTDTYTGPNNGLWQTASDWSTGKTPTASDVACVGAETTVDVTAGTNQAGVLLDAGGLAVSGGSLELAGILEFANTPGLESSTVVNLSVTGGVLSVASELDVSSGFGVSGAPTVSGVGRLVLESGVTGSIGNGSSCSSHLTLSGVTFVNQGTVTFGQGTDVGAGAIAMQSGARLENAGTFNDNSYDIGCGYGIGGQQLSIYNTGGTTPQIVNTGTFNANAGSQILNIAVPFSNQGTAHALSGTLQFQAGGAGTSASWSTASGAGISFSGGSFSLNGDKWSGGIGVAGATVNATGLNAAGANVGISAGSLTIPQGSTTLMAQLSLDGGVLSLAGEADVSSWFGVSGAPAVTGAGRLVLGSGVTGVIGNGSSCSSHLTLSGVTLLNQGAVTFGQGTDVGAGAIAMQSGARLENAGTFDDNSYDIGCGYGIGGQQLSIYNTGGTTPQIVNTGTFNANAGSQTLNIAVPFSNDGTAHAFTGTLQFQAGGAGTSASWSTAAGAAISFSGGSFSLSGDNWSGGIGVAGATVNATGLNAAGASVGVSAGSLTIPEGSTTSMAQLSLGGGALNLAGEADVSSWFGVSGAPAVTGAGRLVLGSGVTGVIGNGSSCSSHLTLSGVTFVNQGTATFGQGTDVGAGAIAMQSGAKLENAGTFNDNSYDIGCGYGIGGQQLSIYNTGGTTPQIVNTGTFNANAGSQTLNIAVPFSNQGTAHALSGTLQFQAGGVVEPLLGGGTADQLATGCWYAKSGASIVLSGGSFLIEEGGAFQVSINGASVSFAPNGLSGSLEEHPYAAGTINLHGHGEESGSSKFALASATVEATAAGTNDWKPLAAPLTPDSSGNFSVQWNTTSGAYPDGHYEVRARLSNNCSCVKSFYTKPSSVRVANSPLTLTPQKAGPDPIGVAQTFTATLSDATGAPLAGKTIVLEVKGANKQTLSAVTNSEGVASFSYRGASEGDDTAQASYSETETGAITSNTASVSWFLARREVSSTPVQGNFFYANNAASGFAAKPGDTPAFSETFPTINFDPTPTTPLPTGTVRNGEGGPFSGAGSVAFEGAGALLSKQTPIAAQSNWTLEAWIDPSRLNQAGMVVYNGDQGSANGYGFGVFGQNGASGGCLTGLYEAVTWINTGYCFASANKWYYVAETNSAGIVTFYVNGSQVFRSSEPTPLAPTGQMIGGYGAGSTRDFYGQISNAAYYTRALSAARIQAHYTAGQSSSASEVTYGGTAQADFPSAFYELSHVPHSGDPWFVSPETRPFTDLTTDELGGVDGAIPAQSGALQAGVGKLESFEAEFTANFNVAAAGDVTFKITSEDGFLLGVGGGASRVSGEYEGAPESNQSAFQGLTLVGAYDKACCSTPQAHFVTVHFPGPGSYPYELDYFQHGSKQLSLTMSVQSVTPDTSPLSVFVGYADGLRPAGSIFPFPWEGSPSVTNFIGKLGPGYDAGALRFDNSSEKAIGLEDVSVDIGASHLDLWGSGITIGAHATTILTQTEGNNFDTSDIPSITCTPDGLIPQIHVASEAQTSTYPDENQILNTGGIDPATCDPSGSQNESTAWTRIGGEGAAIDVPLPPAVALTLSPTTVTGDQVGQTQKLTVTARDSADKPVSGLAIDLHVYGPNGQDIKATTDSSGTATTSYNGKSSGQDIVSATASISGLQAASNQLIVPWAVPPVPQLPPAPPATSGTEPPSVESVSPGGGSIVTGSTAVTAKVGASSSITGWKATLTPADGSAITLGEGSSTPPATLGTIEPSKLGEGSYQLTVSAETSGGSASESVSITIGTTPGVPAPAPSESSSGAPTLEAITPSNQSVIGVSTGVGAKAAAPSGQTISGWTVTLTPQAGGSATTLAETNEEHPSQLAVIEPSKYPSGGYTLTITVHASGGGYATASETVTLGTGVATTTESGTGTTGGGTTTEGTTTTETTTTTTSTETTTTSPPPPPPAPPATPPSIGEISPTEGTVVTTPIQIKAQIKAAEGESIASWTVVAQGSHEQSARTLASGSGSPPEALATFDPTKLPDDTYKVTVLATSSGGAVQSQSSSLIVSGKLKLGRFLHIYKDLEVPVSGFDMRVERIYDSTDKGTGEFGVGWRLSLSGFTVASNGPLGKGGWTQYQANCTIGICGYGYESSPPHTITVTWPDKHQEAFVFTPQGQTLNNIEVEPGFTPKPGTNTTSTLQADEPGEILYGFDGNLYDANFNYWSAKRFLLTTRTGQKLVLDTETGLVSEEDRNGNKLTVTKNGIESSAGPKLAFTRDSQNRITEITGPSSQHLHYGYDTVGDLVSFTDANENTATYSYDASHDLLKTTGPAATKPLQQLVYDTEGRLTEIVDADGNVTKVSANVGERTDTVTDPNGKLTKIATYDTLGDPTEEVKAFEGKTLATKHTYDPEGRLLTTTDPLGHTTTNKWDEHGNLIAHTDANGKTTTYEYDSTNQLTGVIGPDGVKQFTVTRDAQGNPTKIQRADGTSYTYVYDSHGNPTSVTDPSGHTERISYDANQHPATITNGSGAVTQLAYDSSGRLTSEIAPTGASTGYAYDGAGNLTGITDGLGNTTSFAYDAYGHQLTATDPLGHTETSTYDEAGRLIKRVDRNGETTNYSYDPDGKLLEATSYDGEATKIAYDGLEQPVSLANQTQTLTFAYDGDGRVSEASTSAVGSAPATVLKYAYDADGNRTSMSGPDGTTTYGYDALSRLTSLTPSTEPGGQSFNLSYTPTGALESVTRPDGVNDTLAYNGEELTSRTAASSGGTVAGDSYTYNADGLRSSLANSEGATTSYTYDPLGELTEEASSGASTTKYAYDAAGNRTGGSYDAAEQLTSDGTATYSYDAEGQLVKRTVTATGATTTYDWNARHELSAIHLPDGSTESLSYDPLGRLVSMTHGETTTSFVNDGPNVHLEYEGSSTTPAAVYTDGNAPNQAFEMARGGKRYSYLFDGQGSTIALADEAGNIVQRYTYDAFGNPMISGSLQNPLLYTGQRWDPASGLYYYHARWYAPALGRFISRDPVLHANPYPYVENDPTNATDPAGTQASLGEAEGTLAVDSALNGIEDAGIDEQILYHGTDVKSAADIIANGIDQEAARELGGGDVFWTTKELEMARVFAGVAPNEAINGPAIVGIRLAVTIDAAQGSGIIALDQSGAYVVTDWEAFNELATFFLAG